MEPDSLPRKNDASRTPGISELLSGLAAYYGWEDKLEEEQAKTLFRELAGKKIDRHIRRLSFSKGVLYVHIENSAARHELMYRVGRLQEEINGRLGRQVLRAVRIMA
ncbi:MAG: DUF721 domain-containing protein [Bacteroidales bacterium]|nr:DUF721 domain-containing protein [Bacteroidales bacterium]MDE7072126.1 DUF721 domain-containing protein [Bacteroidales bacterium]